MLEASRTQPPEVRFFGLLEMSFEHRKWHEARMEQEQNCKIRYRLKGYTAEYSVREASHTQHAGKIVFLIPQTTCILAKASKRLFGIPPFWNPVKTVSSRVAFRNSACRVPCFIGPVTRSFEKLLYSPDDGSLGTSFECKTTGKGVFSWD